MAEENGVRTPQPFQWNGQPAEFQLIMPGVHSSAFRFEAADGPKVLRVDERTDYGFQKDRYAATHFALPSLPIPPVYAVEQEESGVYYAVSEWQPGTRIRDMEPDGRTQSATAAVSVAMELANVHAGFSGSGWWSGTTETTEYTSWHDAMGKIADLPNTPEVQAHPQFDNNLLLAASDLSKQLLHTYCPVDANSVVHGDLSGNVLVENGTATAVIDWEHSMIGDHMYDVADLDYNLSPLPGSPNYGQVVKDAMSANGTVPEHYDERLLCYKMLRAISDVCHFTKRELPLSDESKQLSSFVDQARTLLGIPLQATAVA